MLDRVCEHVMRAHRVANQDRRAKSPLVDHLVQIRHVMTRAIRPFIGPIAFAMPALIERQHVKIADEGRRDKVPPMRVGGTAMQKQDRRLALASVIKTIQREPVGYETMRLHRSTGISFLLAKPPPAAQTRYLCSARLSCHHLAASSCLKPCEIEPR